MINKRISEIILTNFGQEIHDKALRILDKTIKILISREDPLEIRALIFEKGGLSSLVIDEKKHKYYHNCHSLLLAQTYVGDHICLHLVKLFFLIDEKITFKFLRDFQQYSFMTSFSEILEEKAKNISLMIRNSLDIDKDAYLKNHVPKFPHTMERKYLKYLLNYLINNKFFFEIFHFLNHFVEINRTNIIEDNWPTILLSIKEFCSLLPNYSFIKLLRIIDRIDKFFGNITPEQKNLLIQQFYENFSQKIDNTSINQKYWYYYLKKKYNSNHSYENLEVSEDESFLKHLADHLNNENQSAYTPIDIDILKHQLEILGIVEDDLNLNLYSMLACSKDIQKFFYLKKFALFKLLMKRNHIGRHTFEFERKNDIFIVEHNVYNLKSSFYTDYLLPHLGFFGEKKNLIRARDIGENFYIFDRIFIIDWINIPSILYFKKKMWGETLTYSIKSDQGLSLLRFGVDYIKDSGLDFENPEDIVIIEWDLLEKPIFGSNVFALDVHTFLPDSEDSLFYDIKPFDLCYCNRVPKEIIGSVKFVEVISKCSFKDAIESASKGILCIEKYYPLSLVKKVIDREINPFDAIKMLEISKKKKYVPHFYQFIYEFKEFIFKSLYSEDSFLFSDIEKHSEESIGFIFNILRIDDLIAGIDISHNLLANLLVKPNISRDSLRKDILQLIHNFIRKILKEKEVGSTLIFDLNKMKKTPFSVYSKEILSVRREEFEHSIIPIYQQQDELYYETTQISRTYYGHKILDLLNMRNEFALNEKAFRKFTRIASDLGLSVKSLINHIGD